MIIDAHYHLDPRIQPLENLLAKMDRHGIDKTALIPNMCDPFPHPDEFQLRLLRFLLIHRPLRGIAERLLTRFTPEGDIRLPSGPLKIYPAPDNAPVAAALAEYPDRFLGWIFVNPQGNHDPLDEMDRWAGCPGFIGIKAHPFWHRYAPEALLPVAEKAAAKGMPLLIHPGFGTHGDFMPLANELPELKLILAHAAFPGFKDGWETIRHRQNIYVDLSADAYVDEAITRSAVDALGAERCIFGSDGPFGTKDPDGLFDNGFIKGRLAVMFPNRSIRERILGGNFQDMIS
ncbi:MAG: amidohydrolase [Desulfobacter sp.]|nr:MAG: amidohydrolase [Desulfobacter sp.]